MTREELQKGVGVVHAKHGTHYIVISVTCKMKDSEKGWIDAVAYAPTYPNEYDLFTKELDSFLEEFELV